ncbi:phosphate ABC transporter ATP-binding protein [Actibacterium sp. 188UL27-1]|uniref:phosphate ABC transporter ATP-binding protein n=1 Tax=Actibacterium sp. 188UL27-1 TaxID=2786961 RepID=UPI001958F0DF|nr:phosphate ABC transporter ATP-binding protein [Actibacterium sp. 188UL27-1]MBM7069501.1 phosphate ABC transporter ATP-binding protein [Actibacterium sp. 188UL27-1]
MFDPDHTLRDTKQTETNTIPVISVRHLNLWYGDKQALKDVSFDVRPREILALIGPSGCGKTTALKCLNRMHDDTRGARITGQIMMDGVDINGRGIDPPIHRRRFGWVAQKPNPFVGSVYGNTAYGARIRGIVQGKTAMDAHVENCLRRAELWNEVKDILHTKSGTDLSGGQQQRLCIARALSTEPDVLLMDEPTGSIDPIATAHVEDLMLDLARDHTVIVITHSMMQARRIADRVAYFHLGELLEVGPTEQIFKAAKTSQTQQFIAGRTG